MVREAENAERKADCIHKLAVAQKECDESIYWLELLAAADYLTKKAFESTCTEAAELLKMIRSAIITTKAKKVTSRKATHNSSLITHHLQLTIYNL